MLSILIFLLSLSILVLIHELGHFLMAKKFNIKVLEFGFGIPPRAIGKKIGETIISLNWLPIGGFVHLLGEDEVDKQVLENHRSFAAQKVEKRIVVVVAGVVMNLILAWILYTVVLASQNFKYEIQLLFPHQFVGVVQKDEEVVKVAQVVDGSPAQKAGIKVDERVIALNGEPILSGDDLIGKTKAHSGEQIILTLAKEDGTLSRNVSVIPRKNPPPNQGALGISLNAFGKTTLEYKKWWQKVFVGPIHGYNILAASFDTLGRLIGISLAQHNTEAVSEGFGGPVAIGYVSHLILNGPNPALKFLDLLGGISLSLAFFNVLPIPALDGGRLFFLLIEAITKRKVKPEIEKKVHAVGMAVLMLLFVLITYKDINTFIVPEIGKVLH